MADWSIVNFCVVSEKSRLDAEYYQPKFLEYESLARMKGGPLSDYICRIIQPTEFTRQYVAKSKGAAFWRAQNIRCGYVDLGDTKYIDWSTFNRIRDSHIREGDVLITRTGANAGDCAVVPDGIRNVAVSSHTLRLVPKSIGIGYAIGIFFAGELGREILLRTISGSSRPQITIKMLSGLTIPDFSSIASQTASDIKGFYQKARQSQALYAKAEALLLRELGLNIRNVPSQLNYVATFGEATKSQRLDAEYFHPEKRRVLEQLDSMPGRKLGDYFHSVRHILNPLKYEGEQMVYNYDLNDAMKFFLDDNVKLVSIKGLGSAKKRFRSGDVVVSRLRSYLKEIAIVATPTSVNCVGSSEFIVLRPETEAVGPELLLVYLRSLPVQRVLKWSQDGSNHPRFKEEELLALKLPDRILNIQQDIQFLIRSSIQTQREAWHLLDKAEHEIEEMILDTEA